MLGNDIERAYKRISALIDRRAMEMSKQMQIARERGHESREGRRADAKADRIYDELLGMRKSLDVLAIFFPFTSNPF